MLNKTKRNALKREVARLEDSIALIWVSIHEADPTQVSSIWYIKQLDIIFVMQRHVRSKRTLIAGGKMYQIQMVAMIQSIEGPTRYDSQTCGSRSNAPYLQRN